MTPRSYLFVPADRPDRFGKALASEADAVIVDLEDAVAPVAKAAARARLAEWLEGQISARVVLRINGVETPWFQDDLALCSLPAVSAVVVPKVSLVDTLHRVAQAAPGKPLLPLIESAEGFANLHRVASTRGVERLMFGAIDLQTDLGMAVEDEDLAYFRTQLVLASRLAMLAPPADGVCTVLDDPATLLTSARRARQLGFGAKLCIHPAQAAPVNAGFVPTIAELEWAGRVLAAAEAAASGAVAVDGKMVDAPILRRAQSIVDSQRAPGAAV